MKLLFIFLFSTLTALAQMPEWSRKYHTGSVTCLDFSGDGKMLLSGSYDQTIRLWDVAKGDTDKTFKSINSVVNNLDFNMTGDWFICSYVDGSGSSGFKTTFFSISKYSVLKTVENTTNPTSFGGYPWIGYAYNNRSFLRNKDSILTNIASGQIIHGPGASSRGWISSENLLNSEKSLTFQDLSTFDMFSLNTTKDKAFGGGDWQWGNKSGGVESSASGINYYFFDFISKTKTDVSFKGLQIRSAAITSDDQHVIMALNSGNIYIGKTPQCLVIDSLGSQTSLVTALATDMQGRYYFSAHEDTTLRIWTPGVHNIFKRIPLQSLVTTIVVSPDSIHFATAHNDGTVSYWNIDSLILKAKSDSVFTPFITLQPESKTVCRGSEVVLKTQAVSNFGEEIFYQWQKNGVKISDDANYSGTQSTELKINNADNSHIGKYNANVFTATGGSIFSAAGNLGFIRVLSPIKFQSDTLLRPLPGANISFAIGIQDTARDKFQWFKNGEPVSGEMSPCCYIFRINNAQVEKDNGSYIVKYFNECDTISSKPFIVEVQEGMSAQENPFKNTTLSAEPNPFTNSTTIHFSLPKPLKIKLAVTDILGREVAVVKDEVAEMGEQQVIFKNEDLPDGTYFITLSGDGLLQTIPVQIVR